MATSAATHPLLMATTEPTRLERTASATNSIVTPGADQTRQEQPSKPRPRKMAKQHPPKKQPQRGMGVAQLERLRLQDQERWTKMPEVPPQPYPPYFLPHSNPQRPGFSFPGPLDAASGIPVQQYCVPPTRPPPPVSTGLGLGLGLGMGRGFLVPSKDDGGGDHGRLVPASVPGRVMFDAFGAGAPAGRGGSSKAVETSRELSSIPNAQQCVSDRCDVCLKKKRMDSQNAGLFINRARENYPERMRVGNCDFLGLNLEIPQSKAAARTPVYNTHNLDDDDQNVQVTAIRRRVNISGGGVSMEYEFFPGKSGRSTWTEGLNFPAGEEVAADADASEDSGEASNPIDLSLKLSC